MQKEASPSFKSLFPGINSCFSREFVFQFTHRFTHFIFSPSPKAP
nr:MAG TPA: hypothetical protein [Caudoviricetes sp.]